MQRADIAEQIVKHAAQISRFICMLKCFFFKKKKFVSHDTQTQEKERRQRWREENVRRRHNYIPFVVSLLGILADKGHLPRLIEDAKRKAAARTERDKKRDRETAEKK